jgi:hypothetical protein
VVDTVPCKGLRYILIYCFNRGAEKKEYEKGEEMEGRRN